MRITDKKTGHFSAFVAWYGISYQAANESGNGHITERMEKKMKSNKQKYYEGKEKARQKAIEFQNSFAEGKTWYYSELAEMTEQFKKLAKRYGLIEEFTENGIL